MSSQDNVQTLKEIYAAFKQGDLDGVMAHVAEDIELLAPSLGEFPWGGTFRGRAAYRDRLAGLGEHFTSKNLTNSIFYRVTELSQSSVGGSAR